MAVAQKGQQPRKPQIAPPYPLTNTARNSPTQDGNRVSAHVNLLARYLPDPTLLVHGPSTEPQTRFLVRNATNFALYDTKRLILHWIVRSQPVASGDRVEAQGISIGARQAVLQALCRGDRDGGGDGVALLARQVGQ